MPLKLNSTQIKGHVLKIHSIIIALSSNLFASHRRTVSIHRETTSQSSFYWYFKSYSVSEDENQARVIMRGDCGQKGKEVTINHMSSSRFDQFVSCKLSALCWLTNPIWQSHILFFPFFFPTRTVGPRAEEEEIP